MTVDEPYVSEESPWGSSSLAAAVLEFPAGVPDQGFVPTRVRQRWVVGEALVDALADEVGWPAEVDFGSLPSSRAEAG